MHAVSVVIPNYNGEALLAKHLPLVVAALRPEDEVVIVDDASTDGSWRWLQEWQAQHPTVNLQLLQNSQNRRFAATANSGIAAAKHDLVLLLNSDVTPAKNILEFLIPHFEDSTVFAVGCLEQDGEQRSGKTKLWFSQGLFHHAKADDLTAGEMPWVSGGSVMLDKKKWLELGGFDKAFYPAYWEDVDVSFRARRHHWKIIFEPRAIVTHHHESTNRDVFGQQHIQQMSLRNGYKFTWKHGTIWQRISFLIWLPYWLFKNYRWQAAQRSAQ